MKHTENAKQTLARIHRANIFAQLKVGVCGVREVSEQAGALDDESILSLLTAAVVRTTHEMAVAHALGDNVSRLDQLVYSHIRELFGVATAVAVMERVRALDGAWPHLAHPWPAPRATLAPQRSMSLWTQLAIRFHRFYRGLP